MIYLPMCLYIYCLLLLRYHCSIVIDMKSLAILLTLISKRQQVLKNNLKQLNNRLLLGKYWNIKLLLQLRILSVSDKIFCCYGSWAVYRSAPINSPLYPRSGDTKPVFNIEIHLSSCIYKCSRNAKYYEGGLMVYNEICQELNSGGWTVIFDAEQHSIAPMQPMVGL